MGGTICAARRCQRAPLPPRCKATRRTTAPGALSPHRGPFFAPSCAALTPIYELLCPPVDRTFLPDPMLSAITARPVANIGD
jgi:hypothetical protein